MICAESLYAPCRRSARNFARRHTTEVTADNREELLRRQSGTQIPKSRPKKRR